MKTYFSSINKTTVINLLFFFIALLLLVFSFRDVNLDVFFEQFKSIRLGVLLAIIFFVILQLVCRAFRWRVLLKNLEIDLPVAKVFYAIAIGFGLNNFIPRAGEIAQGMVIKNNSKESLSALFGTIFITRILDIFVVLVIILYGFIYYHHELAEVFPWLEEASLIAAVVLVLIGIGVFILIRMEPYLKRMKKLLPGKENITEKINEIVTRFKSGLSTLRSFRDVLQFAFWSILLITAQALMMYLGFYLFEDFTIHPSTFENAIILVGFGSIAMLAPTPGGIGSTHFIISSALTSFMNNPMEFSLLYASSLHTVVYVTISVTYFVALMANSYKNIQRKQGTI